MMRSALLTLGLALAACAPPAPPAPPVHRDVEALAPVPVSASAALSASTPPPPKEDPACEAWRDDARATAAEIQSFCDVAVKCGAEACTPIGPFATDPRTGLACLIFYVLYQQFENYVIYPRVMSRSTNLPGSVIVIAALVGASLLGVIGALLAIPTAAAITLLVKEVLLPRQAAR